MRKKGKKVLGLMLVVVVCFSCFVAQSSTTHAADIDIDDIEWITLYNGDCGKSNLSVSWDYSYHNRQISDKYYNNCFTLSAGTGENGGVMENYVYKNFGFQSQYSSNGSRKWDYIFSDVYMINIEEGMKVIGDHAFNFGIYFNGISSELIPYPEDSISNVRYVTLPSTLEEIGFCGFAGALKYVDTLTIPSKLAALDYGAFCGNGFNTIVIEEGNLSTIPSYCFANCSYLEEIYIPKTVKTINSGAFKGCTSLKRIYYGGYLEDWENMTIESGNDALLSANISFPIRVHVNSISLNLSNKTLMNGNSFSLLATVLPANADILDVVWTSSNPKVATVSDSGVVTALSAGNTTITATTVDGNKTATCLVAVQNTKIPVSGVSLSEKNIVLQIGKNQNLSATVIPSNATNQRIIWTSSNPDVVSVVDGILLAKKEGYSTITVRTEDGGFADICNIKVEKAPCIEHIYNSTITTPATHLTTGIKTFICDCGDSYTEVIATLEGHTYEGIIIKEATHTEEGVKVYVCDCGASYAESIAKISHDSNITIPSVASTCIKTGLTEGKKCSVCGTVTVAQQAVAMLAHTDDNSDYKCDYNCGYEFEKPADPTPSDPTEDCSCNCHAGGIKAFFFKILNFFQKLFGKNKVCACGVKH